MKHKLTLQMESEYEVDGNSVILYLPDYSKIKKVAITEIKNKS